jgi:hypothetical protein
MESNTRKQACAVSIAAWHLGSRWSVLVSGNDNGNNGSSSNSSMRGSMARAG